MSTRATIHFYDVGQTKPEAIVYRHTDGYPEGLGEDLKLFVKELKDNVSDTRFNDPSYLAAKWVVYDASQMAKYSQPDIEPNKRNKLVFYSVGVVSQDPGDIEYRYKVVCDGKPTITVEEV